MFTLQSKVVRADNKKASKKKAKAQKVLESTTAGGGVAEEETQTPVIGRKLASPR